MGIGERLAEERRRLGLSQEAFAAVGGATKRTQINWEQGVQVPNAAFLAKVAELGVDVLYVVTGVRAAPIESTLTERQQALLDNHQNTDEEGRRAIERQALLEAQRSDAKKAPARRRG